MKHYLQLICAAVSGTLLYACGYQEVADADYMPQQIYIPAASEGVYVVDDIAPDHGPARYKLDLDSRKLKIPLSLYRSGIDNNGVVNASLVISPDSVNKLIAEEKLLDDDGTSPVLFPADKIAIPSMVTIPDGSGEGRFVMDVDLDFLMANPRTRYVVGIELQEADRNIVQTLNYMVVEVNTRFVVPSVLFTHKVTDDTNYIVEFTNASEFGLDYVWDFGDGSDAFEGESPEAHQYPSNGTYAVRLQSHGITGDIYSYIYDLRLWENITPQYIPNAGPFRRKDSGGKTGVLADWDYTDNVTAANGKGGFYLESGGVMDFYSSSADMVNAKIYRTFTLPAGTYRAAFTPYAFRGVNDCCFVVAAASGLPDLDAVATDSTVLGSFGWSEELADDQYGFEFELASETTVSFGFVVTNEKRSRVQIRNVSLYR